MQAISYINIDIIETTMPPRVYAKQYDEDGRWIYATVTENGAEYPIPDGAYAVFSAAKPDGTFAIYDSNAENDVAIFIDGSVVKVQLIAAALDVAGVTKAQISLYSANAEKITTFTFDIDVEKSVVDDNSVASDYVNVLTGLIQQAVNAENGAVAAKDAAEAAAGQMTNAVRYDVAQTLTDAQKQTACDNIGVTDAVEDALFPVSLINGGTGADTILGALEALKIMASGINVEPQSAITQFQYYNGFSWYTAGMSTAEFMAGMPNHSAVLCICSMSSGARMFSDAPEDYMMMLLVKGSSNAYRNGIAWRANTSVPRVWVFSGNSVGESNWRRILTSADFVYSNGVLSITTT